MAQLIIQGVGTGGDLRHKLRPGVNRLGRRDSNEVQIVHPTISGEHCELVLRNDALAIRDLGSTNGTFLGAERIVEGMVQSGQSFRAGDISISFVGDNPLGAGVSVDDVHVAIPQAAPSAAVHRDEFDCHEEKHAGIAAEYYCPHCASQWCADCIKILGVAGRSYRLCRRCSNKCIPMAEHKKMLGLERASFLSQLWSAFTYPLYKNGPWYVVGGALFFSVMDVLQRFAFFGIGMLLGVTYVGYLFAYMRDIILTSAKGDKEMPGWPDFGNFADDILSPFLQFAAIWAVCILPGVLIAFSGGQPVLGLGVGLLGLFVLPMALLAVAMFDTIGALNPVTIFASIAKIPVDYVVTYVSFVLVLGGAGLINRLLVATHIPVFPTLVGSMIGLYGMIVNMRILGLLYYANRKRLGWFER